MFTTVGMRDIGSSSHKDIVLVANTMSIPMADRMVLRDERIVALDCRITEFKDLAANNSCRGSAKPDILYIHNEPGIASLFRKRTSPAYPNGQFRWTFRGATSPLIISPTTTPCKNVVQRITTLYFIYSLLENHSLAVPANRANIFMFKVPSGSDHRSSRSTHVRCMARCSRFLSSHSYYCFSHRTPHLEVPGKPPHRPCGARFSFTL